MTEPMKTAEDYWYDFSHESILEGLREITEANFKQAIRACQSDCKAAEREKIKKLIEYAFIAGRSKTTWEQFKKDHELIDSL